MGEIDTAIRVLDVKGSPTAHRIVAAARAELAALSAQARVCETLRAENARLREELLRIKMHQEIATGTSAYMSATHNIAEAGEGILLPTWLSKKIRQEQGQE